jgi:hypothetical protein
MNTNTFFGFSGATARIGVGKLTGFAVGLLGFIFLPFFWPAADLYARFGILFWYTTVGAVVGAFGVVTSLRPWVDTTLVWWVRDILVGAWMNFVLTLFAHDMMRAVLAAVFGQHGTLQSPYWFVLEGALVGLLAGYMCHRFETRA